VIAATAEVRSFKGSDFGGVSTPLENKGCQNLKSLLVGYQYVSLKFVEYTYMYVEIERTSEHRRVQIIPGSSYFLIPSYDTDNGRGD
jgi:hypothetical protein